jgi:flagellar export protein FliJ
MKPFRFRLARLLHLKHAEKKQRAAELAREQHELRRTESALADSREQCAKVQHSYAALSARPARACEWDGAVHALGAAELEISRRIDLVRRAGIQVELARERLIQKAREAETLDRLRQRQWSEHVHESLRSEQKDNDAKAVARFIRDRDVRDQDS